MPAKMTTAELRDGGKPWQQLDGTQYSLDPNRTIAVRLMPNEALRIQRMQRGGMQIDESEEAKTFSLEELSMTGRSGEVKVERDRVRKSFVAESKQHASCFTK